MSLTKSIVQHPEWGTLTITRNPRARRIIMRARPNAILVTVPLRATMADIERALSECGERLKQQQQAVQRRIIDAGFRIESDNLYFSIKEHSATKFFIKYNGRNTTLFCPYDTPYHNNNTQEWLRRVIAGAVRRRAKALLPQRLAALAAAKEFRYTACSVRNVHSRWGSCSTKGNISLSIYLVLLPDELIDYVLLHELCHTQEMNHSERFWTLMDKAVAPAKAKALRAKLMGYKTDF